MAQESGLIVSVSGIRGVVGQGLTPEAASGLRRRPGHATPGRPGRAQPRRPAQRRRCCGTPCWPDCSAAGCEVHDLGVAADADLRPGRPPPGGRGGIQITASHNPAQWNGLKLFGPDGARAERRGGPADQGALRRGLVPPASAGTSWARVADCRQAEDWHRERVLELVDVPQIRGRATARLPRRQRRRRRPARPRLLEALSARPSATAATPTATSLHEPEPIAANLREVVPAGGRRRRRRRLRPRPGLRPPGADRRDGPLHRRGADAGPGGAASACAAGARAGGHQHVHVARGRGHCRRASACRVTARRSARPTSVEKMREVGAVIGGEGNGGVIDPRVGFVRDPFIGMGLVLNLLADTRQEAERAGRRAAGLSHRQGQVRGGPGAAAGSCSRRWSGAGRRRRSNRLDGLRLDWADRWVHVRPSNTEPIVRVIAEAPRAEEAWRLCEEVGALLRG